MNSAAADLATEPIFISENGSKVNIMIYMIYYDIYDILYFHILINIHLPEEWKNKDVNQWTALEFNYIHIVYSVKEWTYS